VFPHEPPLERLVGLDTGLVGLRAERVDPGVVQCVGDTGGERCLRADDGERGVNLARVRRYRLGVRRVERLEPLGERDDARVPVARAGVQVGVRVG